MTTLDYKRDPEPAGHEACGTTEGHVPAFLDPGRRLVVKASTNMAAVRKNSAVRLPHMHGERLLIEAGRVAILGFGLRVWQWLPQHVGTHSANSYHSRRYPDGIGKAFDAFGAAMHAFADYLNQHAPQLDELIFNCCDSRKNGQHVPPSFWGLTVWGAHTNHAHVANDGPALTVKEHKAIKEQGTFALLGLAV